MSVPIQVSIPIPTHIPRFQYQGLQTAFRISQFKKGKKIHSLEFGSFENFFITASGTWETLIVLAFASVSYDKVPLQMKSFH